VLHIGFGSGGTAYAVSRYPVEQITIAEISRSVIEKASAYFQEINHGVLDDPRVNVVFTDGRNRVLADEQKYDVILSDSVHPRFSGNGSLYTYDYYKLLRERLNPGGVVSQWLPFYSLTLENFQMIIKSFYEVFPNTTVWYPNSTINAYVIVIGKLDNPLIDYANMEHKLQRPEVVTDLQEIETTTPYKLLDYFLFANEAVAEYVGDVALHTDDNMAVEYLSGRVMSKGETTYLNYVSLIEHRTSVKPYLSRLDEASEDPQMILSTFDLYEQATHHNLIGQQLFLERKRPEAIAEFEKIPALNPDDLEPVEFFGASYQEPFLWMAGPGM
jgi:spermidine synthase